MALGALVALILKPNMEMRADCLSMLFALAAFICFLWSLYFRNAEIPVRGGAKITAQSNPIAYHLWFVGASGLAFFLIFVLAEAAM